MDSDTSLAQYEAVMRNYYTALDNDQPNADDLLALANACYVDYDRALQAEFDSAVDATSTLNFYAVNA